MKINDIKVSSIEDRKRVGRGIGSGYGKTAGRGTKGQNARTGGGTRPGFEGGQNPLAKRLPKKRGFVPRTRTIYQVVNLFSLDTLKDGSTVEIDDLKSAGLIKNVSSPVKLLGSGELTKKLTLKVHAASSGARTAIEKAGGKVEILQIPVSTGKKRTRPKEVEAE